MNKLSKLSLKTTGKVLSNREMKVIAGGYSNGPDGKCASRYFYWQYEPECADSASEAIANSGVEDGNNEGWWCCNCAEASTC